MSRTLIFAPGKTTVADTRTLDEAIDEAVARTEREHAQLTDAGLAWNGHVIDIDDRSTARMGQMVQFAEKAGGLPAGFAWTTQANAQMPVTAVDLTALGIAAAQRVYALHAALQVAKAAARSAATREAADAVKAEWPA